MSDVSYVLHFTWLGPDGSTKSSAGTHGFSTMKLAKEAVVHHLAQNKVSRTPLDNYKIQIIQMAAPTLDAR